MKVHSHALTLNTSSAIANNASKGRNGSRAKTASRSAVQVKIIPDTIAQRVSDKELDTYKTRINELLYSSKVRFKIQSPQNCFDAAKEMLTVSMKEKRADHMKDASWPRKLYHSFGSAYLENKTDDGEDLDLNKPTQITGANLARPGSTYYDEKKENETGKFHSIVSLGILNPNEEESEQLSLILDPDNTFIAALANGGIEEMSKKTHSVAIETAKSLMSLRSVSEMNSLTHEEIESVDGHIAMLQIMHTSELRDTARGISSFVPLPESTHVSDNKQLQSVFAQYKEADLPDLTSKLFYEQFWDWVTNSCLNCLRTATKPWRKKEKIDGDIV